MTAPIECNLFQIKLVSKLVSQMKRFVIDIGNDPTDRIWPSFSGSVLDLTNVENGVIGALLTGLNETYSVLSADFAAASHEKCREMIDDISRLRYCLQKVLITSHKA
jgi:Flp pilus assembly CpaE family ATPase